MAGFSADLSLSGAHADFLPCDATINGSLATGLGEQVQTAVDSAFSTCDSTADCDRLAFNAALVIAEVLGTSITQDTLLAASGCPTPLLNESSVADLTVQYVTVLSGACPRAGEVMEALGNASTTAAPSSPRWTSPPPASANDSRNASSPSPASQSPSTFPTPIFTGGSPRPAPSQPASAPASNPLNPAGLVAAVAGAHEAAAAAAHSAEGLGLGQGLTAVVAIRIYSAIYLARSAKEEGLARCAIAVTVFHAPVQQAAHLAACNCL
ncbi:hypothetical protein N2152v2_000007 [Parachlorella kessleri]